MDGLPNSSSNPDKMVENAANSFAELSRVVIFYVCVRSGISNSCVVVLSLKVVAEKRVNSREKDDCSSSRGIEF